MILSPSKCAVLASDRTGAIEPRYLVAGNVLPVVTSVRDLGLKISVDLDFSDHVSGIAKTARSIVNCIFLCFIVGDPNFYTRLYNSLVVSRFIYCCTVWLPHKKRQIRLLESVQSYFLNRLRRRCNLLEGAFVLSPTIQTLSGLDVGMIGRINELDLVDHFFEVRKNSLRSRCTVAPKALPRSDLIANMFSWRACSKVGNNNISSCIFL